MNIYEIRRVNLQTALNEKFSGKPRLLADAMDKNGSQISRYLKPRGGTPENMGDSVARQIENAAGYSEGWLDRVHETGLNIDRDNLPIANIEDEAEIKAMEFVDIFERELDINLSRHDKHDLFKRIRDRYLRLLLDGNLPPTSDKAMKNEVIDFAEIAKLSN